MPENDKKEWYQRWWLHYPVVFVILPFLTWIALDMLLPYFFEMLKLDIVDKLAKPINLFLTILSPIVTEIEIKRYSATKKYEKKSKDLENDYEVKFEVFKKLSEWVEKNPVPIALSFNNKLTKNNLNHLSEILSCSVADSYKPYWANIYLMRSLTPAKILQHNKEDSLFLFRMVEEASGVPGGKRGNRMSVDFQLVQEEDYRQLFGMVENSYYATSYGDHDVWVIDKWEDLDFYVDNYRQDVHLKVSGKDISFLYGGKQNNLKRGIHRVFILDLFDPESVVNTDDAKLFVEGFKKMIKEHTGEYDISKLQQKWNITNDKDLKSHPKVKFLSVLLAGKICKKLDMGFGILQYDKKDDNLKMKLINLCVIPESEGKDEIDEGVKQFRNIGWKRLGSALFDIAVYGYAEKGPSKASLCCPKCQTPVLEASTEGNAIIYYEFENERPQYFANEMVTLINQYKEFSKVQDKYREIINMPELNNIAEELAKEIKAMTNT